MENMEPNKNTYTSDVGTRVFVDPWPPIATHGQRNPQELASLDTSGEPVCQSYIGNREHMTSTSLERRPSLIGIGITRLSGSTFFPPGPQKSYYPRRPPLGLQNTNLRPHLAVPASGLAPNSPKGPPRLTAALFKQQRNGGYKRANSGHRGLKDTKSPNDSDSDSSDEDGGVALASSLAVFMQSPGDVKMPLRSADRKSDMMHRQEPEKQESVLQEKRLPKAELKKLLPKPGPSLALQLAVSLQTPGGVDSASRRLGISTPPTNHPPSITYPVYHLNMKLKREEKEKEEEIYEYETRSQSGHVETASSFGKSRNTQKLPTSPAGGHKDIDTSQHQPTPDTLFEYASPMPKIAITTQGQTKLPSVQLSGRRVFQQLKDGDIVGDRASELPKANKGRLMMERMGYKEGTTLGVNGDRGLIEPVKVEVRLGNRGLGLAKQESRLPTHTSTNRGNLTQVTPPKITPVGMSKERSFDIITRQLQNMGSMFPRDVVYSLVTPLGAYQIRMRMLQILSQFDTVELLSVVDYNYILALCMDKVATIQQQSRSGNLVETDLIQAVTVEYKRAVLRADQSRAVPIGR